MSYSNVRLGAYERWHVPVWHSHDFEQLGRDIRIHDGVAKVIDRQELWESND